jgi:uncharacterized protein YcbX
MAHVARLRVFPIKSLDGHDVDAARLVGSGGLDSDRAYAICDPAGDPVTGKRDAGVHRIRATFQPRRDSVTVELPADDAPAETLSLDADRGALNAWLSGALDRPVSLIKDRDGGFPDHTDAPGPTIVSTATLRRVAEWTGLSVHSIRRRFRANVEVAGVRPFWEDRLYGPEGTSSRLAIGDTTLAVTGPCRRCVVPTRDPDTGDPTPGFRETFVGHRRASRPAWASPEDLEEHFRLAVTTTVPEQRRPRVAVGDPVQPVSE